MKNKLTRKLMLSAFTLLFAVISLGASTYAWFTISDLANVEAFTADVKAAEGIEISVTDIKETTAPSTWYSGTLPQSVIEAVYKKDGFELDALTTKDLTSFTKLNSDEGVATGYVEFKIWIKSAVDGVVELNSLSITGPTTPSKYTIDQEFILSDSETVKAQLQEQWTFNVASAARVALKAEKNTKYFEASKVEADANAKNAGNSLGFCEDGKGAVKYYNLKTDQDETTEIKAPTEGVYTSEVFNSDVQFLYLKAGVAEAISIYVWVEGWDGECLNAIFAQTLSVAFVFDFTPHAHNYDESGVCTDVDCKAVKPTE